MNNSSKDEIETKTDDHVWTHGKPASTLESSGNNMSDVRKEVIRQALKFNIMDIRTYTGYQGDLLVEITSMRSSAVLEIKKIAEELGLKTSVTKDSLSIHKLYCISPSSNIYDLK